MTIATLPMYDFEELRPATDALWAAIATRAAALGVAVPACLLRGPPLDEMWADPALLLGQTCGYPLVTSLAGRVALVATPRYRTAGCDGAFYRSAIVVRVGDAATCLADLRGRICAVNDGASNSGMNLLRAAIAPFAAGVFFNRVVMTGAHVASMHAVASGEADVAAIDCVTWAHMSQLRPAVTHPLRVLAWTEATPGLPFITSINTDMRIRGILVNVLHDVAHDAALAAVRDALLLEGFEVVPHGAYDAILELKRKAEVVGYAELK